MIQSIFMAILFHNEKIMYSSIKDNLKKKEEGEGGNHLKELSKDQNYKKIIENWRKFKDCLNENDRNTFIKMIKNVISNIHYQYYQITKKNSIRV